MEREKTKFKDEKLHLSAENSSPSHENDKRMDRIKTKQKGIFVGGKRHGLSGIGDLSQQV